MEEPSKVGSETFREVRVDKLQVRGWKKSLGRDLGIFFNYYYYFKENFQDTKIKNGVCVTFELIQSHCGLTNPLLIWIKNPSVFFPPVFRDRGEHSSLCFIYTPASLTFQQLPDWLIFDLMSSQKRSAGYLFRMQILHHSLLALCKRARGEKGESLGGGLGGIPERSSRAPPTPLFVLSDPFSSID